MTKKAFVLPIAMLTILGAAAPAQASTVYTFTFNDEYYVSSLTTFQSIFGATATGYSAAGIYQETNTATPTITRLGNGSGVPGEYQQNSTPNATDDLALFGWTQSLNNGQQVANVYNLANPLNGAVLYFHYTVGGTTTPFTFNSFDLRGAAPTADLDFTLEGFLGGSLVDSAILDVHGNTFTTFTENWTNVDTVEVVSTAGLPVNWGSGTLYLDNVTLNNSPEPASIVLVGTMLVAFSLFLRKRQIRGGNDSYNLINVTSTKR